MVEILNYEKVNRNKTIGYVDIKVPILKPTTLIFRKIAHLQSGDKKWFNFPSFQKEQNGAVTYTKYYQFEAQEYNPKLLSRLQDKVAEFCEKHGINEVQEMIQQMKKQEEEIPF